MSASTASRTVKPGRSACLQWVWMGVLGSESEGNGGEGVGVQIRVQKVW